MKDKTFHKTAGILFLIVGISHLIRAIMQWPLNVDNFMIAVWFSYLAGFFILWLSYYSFKLAKRT